MKTIKINREYALSKTSRILVRLFAFTLLAHCPFGFFEPVNPKLKNLK